MKLIKTDKITIINKYYEVHDDILLVTRYENSKLLKAHLTFSDESKLKINTYPAKIVYVKDEFWELLKTQNIYDKLYQYCNQITDNIDNININNLILNYDTGRLLYFLNKTPITTVLQYDYCGTPFRSDESDLVPLLNHLKNHPWIINPDKLHIREIDSYNQYEDSHIEYISGIQIYIPQKDYTEIYNQFISSEGFKYLSLLKFKNYIVPFKYTEAIPDYLNINKFRLKI